MNWSRPGREGPVLDVLDGGQPARSAGEAHERSRAADDRRDVHAYDWLADASVFVSVMVTFRFEPS